MVALVATGQGNRHKKSYVEDPQLIASLEMMNDLYPLTRLGVESFHKRFKA